MNILPKRFALQRKEALQYKFDSPCQNLPHFPLTKLHSVGTYPSIEFWTDDSLEHLASCCCPCTSRTSSFMPSIATPCVDRQDRNDLEENGPDVGTRRRIGHVGTTKRTLQRKSNRSIRLRVRGHKLAVGTTIIV